MAVDESGRCVRTELLPEQCGCPDHRNSEGLVYTGLTVEAVTTARFEGTCALDANHVIEAGEEIGRIVQTAPKGTVTEAGWVCSRCVQAIRNQR